MLKVTMLATLIAGIAMGTNIAANTRVAPLAERDAEIIVEVDRSNKALTEEGIHNTQQIVMNNIRKYVTSNFEVISEYSEVANAFAISVNSEIIEQIKKVPGVKSVTRNQIHWVTEPQSYSGSGTVSRDHSEYGGTTNISAVTMNKSNDTNDGEGTVIAVFAGFGISVDAHAGRFLTRLRALRRSSRRRDQSARRKRKTSKELS